MSKEEAKKRRSASAGAAADRVFAHVRVHGLGASVEEREHGGRAVVLCDENGHRVVSASPAAWERGVQPGMSRWEAERRCPELLVAEPEEEKYEYFWRRVVEICCDYGADLREVAGDKLPGDEGEGGVGAVSLDLTGSELLLGPAKSVGQEIRNRLRVELGLTASVGIGPNRMVARLACETAPPGEVVEVTSEEAEEFVGRLPIEALPGVDEDWTERLGAMGLRRAGDLAALPEDAVERALGWMGRRLWEVARGRDSEETRDPGSARNWRRGEDAISARVELRPPTEERERIGAALRAAAEEVGRRLRERGEVAGQVRIGVVFRDLRQVGARRTLAAPTRSSEVIFRAAQALLARMKLNGRLVRRVKVSAAGLAVGPKGGQMALPLVEQEERRERLAEMVERIRDRFGEGAVRRANVAGLVGSGTGVRE
jgi:DNA polymerase-4